MNYLILVKFFLLNLTSRIIGKDANKEIRPNDGVVPVISSQHPSNQAFKKLMIIHQLLIKVFGK